MTTENRLNDEALTQVNGGMSDAERWQIEQYQKRKEEQERRWQMEAEMKQQEEQRMMEAYKQRQDQMKAYWGR